MPISCRPLTSKKHVVATTTILLFVLAITVAFISYFWNIGSFWQSFDDNSIFRQLQSPPQEFPVPLDCTLRTPTQTCPAEYPKTIQTLDRGPYSEPTCPDYFRWIHEDLKPWNVTGITRDMVERAKRTAYFHVIIVSNKLYIKRYRMSVQSREVFTIWGILQLLRRYPGRLPDLELMFDTDDRPVIRSSDYSGPNRRISPPPLFKYCTDRSTMDIVFPDWSFWGWPQTNITSWDSMLRQIKEANKRIKWLDREPYAYWKGNFHMSTGRKDLRKCNVSAAQDWNIRLYHQDWPRAVKQGFKDSNLVDQCTHRYKIYIEGNAWSVSGKYILACDSMTLLVEPRYYDFYMRYLQPLQHYWPISVKEKCKSIKFAVDWGNSHKQKAQEIGKAASNLIQEDLKMDYVYDYMFHLLNEYAKLLKFKPIIPDGAVEACLESMACMANGLRKKFMVESVVKDPSNGNPCTLPPHEPEFLEAFHKREADAIRKVRNWEGQMPVTFQ